MPAFTGHSPGFPPIVTATIAGVPRSLAHLAQRRLRRSGRCASSRSADRRRSTPIRPVTPRRSGERRRRTSAAPSMRRPSICAKAASRIDAREIERLERRRGAGRAARGRAARLADARSDRRRGPMMPFRRIGADGVGGPASTASRWRGHRPEGAASFEELAARQLHRRIIDRVNFDPTWLFLSLIPSGIGFVLFVYGKKQQRWPHMLAGIVFIGLSLLHARASWSMVAVGVALGTGLWLAVRAGWSIVISSAR